MRIGYACLAVAVPGSEMRSCILKNASPERLLSLIAQNLDALDTLIHYNLQHGIRLFRISSDLIPFGSSIAAELPWQQVFAGKLSAIGQRIRSAGMRVSMHPGQYTVLNSPDASVAARAVDDLAYHASVLDGMGLGAEHKIILHLGGEYGNKAQAIHRFVSRCQDLPTSIINRLVIENDDRIYNIQDVLDVSSTTGIPVVYDSLHNAVNPADKAIHDAEWIRACSAGWQDGDGPQKIHYSQQNPGKNPGAHSATIRIAPFLAFWHSLSGMNVDIMLEVKDKNISALKCIHCTHDRGIVALEDEWAHYKYCILEHSPGHYQGIRALLRNKSEYPALDMYQRMEDALDMPATPGNAVNAAQHVWGYFKGQASEAEKTRFQLLLQGFSTGETGIQPVKRHLMRLAVKYQADYLLNGYYFSM